ncbi:MAG TPA: hypothetical protein VIN40_04575 [Candidatus Tyrphobacter sp.]
MLTRFTAFIKTTIGKAALTAGMLAAVATFVIPQPASADTGSTAAIITAAALIVGAIAYDSGGRPYYVRGGRRWYVSPGVANYYRGNYGYGYNRYGNNRYRYGNNHYGYNRYGYNRYGYNRYGNNRYGNNRYGNNRYGNGPGH